MCLVILDLIAPFYCCCGSHIELIATQQSVLTGEVPITQERKITYQEEIIHWIIPGASIFMHTWDFVLYILLFVVRSMYVS